MIEAEVENNMKVSPRVKRVIAEDREYISGSLVRSIPFVIKKGRGAIITDIDENEYIDLLSGATVTNVGHNHPAVIKAAKKAMEEIVHGATLYLYNESVIKLARRLNEITPGNFQKKVFFGLSGSDAIDCALKLVRYHSGRPRTLSFIGAYHGMTMGALSLSAFTKTMCKRFMPLVPGIVHVPYPFCYRCPLQAEYPGCDLLCIKFIEEQVFEKYCPPEEVSAVFIEPIQGDAGIVVPPDEYMPKLSRLCEEYGIIIVADEIQTGFGRTGKMFACNHWMIEPDVIVLGKAIASGFPLSAVVARKEIMDWVPGAHIITCGGSPMCCEASLATIDVLEKENLVRNAAEIGAYLKSELEKLKNTYDLVGDVRGKGMMIGVDLVKDRDTKEPATNEAHKVCFRAWELGLIMMYLGKSTLRIAPPLCLRKEQADQAIAIIDTAIGDVVSGKIPNEKIEDYHGWK